MKRFTFILLVFSLAVISQPLFVHSQTGGNTGEIDALNDEIAERKAKIAELEKSIESYKKKISQKRLESSSLSNQTAILENHIVKVELDIEATQEKIDTIALEIEALDLSIEDKQDVIERQKKILKTLIQEIHYSDSKKFIEILAAYDNFSEFFNRIRYLEQIEGDLGKTARGLRLAKEDLEEKKGRAEERRLSYETLNDELSNKKLDLGEQVDYKSSLLAQTKASERTYQTLLSSLRSQYQQIENEIVSIEAEVRKRLSNSGQVENLGDGSKLSWPTNSRYITARFHDPDYPFRHVFEHSGTDIRAGQGTTLRAAASGYVARARRCSSSRCYSYVMLVHSGGFSTVYGHMSSIVVSEDQFVTRGDIIGYSGGMPGTVGAGPFVTGPHLHFEVRKNGIPVNPLNYLVRDW